MLRSTLAALLTVPLLIAWRLRPPGRPDQLALLGEAFLMDRDTTSAASVATLAGDLLVAAGALSAAAGHVAGARLARSFGTWPTTFWAIAAGGALLLPVLLWQGEAAALAAASAATWAAVLFLAGGSTLLAFAAWYWALSRGGIARMGALQFLQPLVTLALAALLLGEPITPALLGATGLILAGVALTQYRRSRRP
jgi:drug/metabolite transporter (DMT)-like permease